MSPYYTEGTLTTEQREVAVSETWDSWENPQSSSNVEVVDGTLQLAEAPGVPNYEDLHAHYDFSEYSGTSNFSDLTGNGYDLVNGSITGVGESINGLQAGEFDGGDDAVWSDTFSQVSLPITVFAVADLGPSSPSNHHQIYQLTADGFHGLFWHDSEVWRVWNGAAMDGSNDSTSQLFSVVSNGGNSLIREDGSQTGTGDPASDDGLDVVGIGAREPDTEARFFEGAIGEILIYPDRRTSSQISDVESYLADKWGVTI